MSRRRVPRVLGLRRDKDSLQSQALPQAFTGEPGTAHRPQRLGLHGDTLCSLYLTIIQILKRCFPQRGARGPNHASQGKNFSRAPLSLGIETRSSSGSADQELVNSPRSGEEECEVSDSCYPATGLPPESAFRLDEKQQMQLREIIARLWLWGADFDPGKSTALRAQDDSLYLLLLELFADLAEGLAALTLRCKRDFETNDGLASHEDLVHWVSEARLKLKSGSGELRDGDSGCGGPLWSDRREPSQCILDEVSHAVGLLMDLLPSIGFLVYGYSTTTKCEDVGLGNPVNGPGQDNSTASEHSLDPDCTAGPPSELRPQSPPSTMLSKPSQAEKLPWKISPAPAHDHAIAAAQVGAHLLEGEWVMFFEFNVKGVIITRRIDNSLVNASGLLALADMPQNLRENVLRGETVQRAIAEETPAHLNGIGYH